jgi:hypothetical protein
LFLVITFEHLAQRLPGGFSCKEKKNGNKCIKLLSGFLVLDYAKNVIILICFTNVTLLGARTLRYLEQE